MEKFFDYNKFTSNVHDTKIKQKTFFNKSDISNLIEKSDLNTKLATRQNRETASIWIKLFSW